MSDYPEHDKLMAVREESQTLGEFIEWLPTADLRICEPITKTDCRGGGIWNTWSCIGGRKINDRADEDEGECPICGGTGMVDRDEPLYLPAHLDINKLLAKFFNIDLAKIETEKRAMLEALRAANA